MTRKGFILLFCLLIISPLLYTALFFIGNIQTPLELLHPYNFSIISGALAFNLFISQLILSSRVPFLEREIGQDKLIKIHTMIGPLLGLLLLIHGTLKIKDTLAYRGFNLSFISGIILVILFFLLGFFAFIVLQKKRKGFNYDKTKKNHNLFTILALISLVHVCISSSSQTPLIIFYTIFWGALGLLSYLYHRLFAPLYPVILIDKKFMSPQITTLRFSKPKSFFFKAGQFIYLTNNKKEHPFTISSSEQADYLECTIKEEGEFTKNLRNLNINNSFKIRGPYGRFSPRTLPQNSSIIALMGGIGITPILSILQTPHLAESYNLSILWSLSHIEDIQLATPTDRLTLFLTRETQVPNDIKNGFIGHIEAEDIAYKIKELTCPRLYFFICGPPQFKKSMVAKLKILRISSKQIISENFYF